MTRSPVKPITLPEFRPSCSDVDDGRVAAQECTGSEWLVSAMEPELQKDTFFLHLPHHTSQAAPANRASAPEDP